MFTLYIFCAGVRVQYSCYLCIWYILGFISDMSNPMNIYYLKKNVYAFSSSQIFSKFNQVIIIFKLLGNTSKGSAYSV